MKKWIQAARLRTLPLSLAGIIVGAGLSVRNNFNPLIFILCILTASLLQILSNFANDYGDFVKGTDNENRIGPQRAMQAGAINHREMKIALITLAFLSLISGIALSYLGTLNIDLKYLLGFIGLGCLSIVAAIKYTVGKSAYGYAGLGDVFVFIFFGLVAVLGSAFLISGQFHWSYLLPATTVGLLSAGVLNLNNMRDIENDANSNKNTIVVRMGTNKAKQYHFSIIVLALLLSLFYTFIKFEDFTQLLYFLAYIPIAKHLAIVYKTQKPKDFDPELKKLALSTFLFAILFLIGNVSYIVN